MPSGYSTPVMRSLTFLLLTTSAATAATAQQPRSPAIARGRATWRRAAAQIAFGARADLEGRHRARGGAAADRRAQLQDQARRACRRSCPARSREAIAAQAEVDGAPAARADRRRRVAQSQMLRTQLASLCDRNAKPQGYMGITFSATMRADAAASGAEVFRFAENPTVETVEPGSPAERAGCREGRRDHPDRRPASRGPRHCLHAAAAARATGCRFALGATATRATSCCSLASVRRRWTTGVRSSTRASWRRSVIRSRRCRRSRSGCASFARGRCRRCNGAGASRAHDTAARGADSRRSSRSVAVTVVRRRHRWFRRVAMPQPAPTSPKPAGAEPQRVRVLGNDPPRQW